MSLTDRLRAAIQAVIDDDSAGDGWQVSQYVVVMGLERVGLDGAIEATSWYWCPPDQADWMTVGLLESGMEMRSAAELDD